jgi:hypothetical protein
MKFGMEINLSISYTSSCTLFRIFAFVIALAIQSFIMARCILFVFVKLRFMTKCALRVSEPGVELFECCTLILLLSVQETYLVYNIEVRVHYCSVGLCIINFLSVYMP